jgi:hypothetical protein
MAVLFVVVLGAGSVAGTAALLHWLRGYQSPQHAAPQGVAQAASAPMKHVFLSLDTFPNFPSDAWIKEHHYHYVRPSGVPVIDTHDDWVLYGPTPNLVVPAHSEVTLTIRQYDSGISLLNEFYSHVVGTIGNTMAVDGKAMPGLPADQVAHTFTIHGTAPDGQPYLYVNVPLMRLPDDVVNAGADNGMPPHPHVVTFSFYVSGPGHYIWQCEYPCGTSFNSFGGPMSTNGYMNGSFDVVA